LALITQIREQAADLGEQEAVVIAFVEALQIQSTPQPFSTTEAEAQAQTEVEGDSPEEVQDDECVEEEAAFDDPYSTPEELAPALERDDPETILMGIANVLDSAPAVEIEGRVWYFVQHLPLELSDRLPFD
jgi:catalase